MAIVVAVVFDRVRFTARLGGSKFVSVADGLSIGWKVFIFYMPWIAEKQVLRLHCLCPCRSPFRRFPSVVYKYLLMFLEHCRCVARVQQSTIVLD